MQEETAVVETPPAPPPVEATTTPDEKPKFDRKAHMKNMRELRIAKLAKQKAKQAAAESRLAAATAGVKEEDLDEDDLPTLEYAGRVNCTCGARLACLKGKSKMHCEKFLTGQTRTKVCQKNLPRFGVDEKGNKVTLIYLESEVPPPHGADETDNDADVDLES